VKWTNLQSSDVIFLHDSVYKKIKKSVNFFLRYLKNKTTSHFKIMVYIYDTIYL